MLVGDRAPSGWVFVGYRLMVVLTEPGAFPKERRSILESRYHFMSNSRGFQVLAMPKAGQQSSRKGKEARAGGLAPHKLASYH